MRLSSLALLLAAAGCVTLHEPFDYQIAKINSDQPDEREQYFEDFVNAPPEMTPLLKARLEDGYAHGYPIAAILYAMGKGDGVPLEIKVIHFARFKWPARFSTINTVLELYVWNEIERDILRVGRPAMRLLGRALADEVTDEERAARVAGLMIRGGAGAEEFARLLDARPVAASAAGAALLHLGYQDVTLVGLKDYAAAARSWWEAAKGKSEDDWIAEGAARAVERLADPGEVALWVPYLSLLFGRDLADKSAALAAWEMLKSLPPSMWVEDAPKDPVEIAHSLRTAGRAAAWQANRKLERALGVRLDDGAALSRLDDYSGARALWQRAPTLALRWERYLASATMHLTALVIGRDPKSGAGGVARICDQYFHGTEDETGGGRVPLADGQFMIYLQSRALGTKLIYSEFLYGGAVSRGFTNQFAIDNDNPVIVFNADMRACAVVLLEDVPSRAPPLPPMLVGPYLAKNLLRLLDAPLMPKAARALGYLGNTAAADAIAARAKAVVDRGDLAALAAALVLLDDPRGLDLGVAPALAQHEIEMVRAFAKNDRIRKLLLPR